MTVNNNAASFLFEPFVAFYSFCCCDSTAVSDRFSAVFKSKNDLPFTVHCVRSAVLSSPWPLRCGTVLYCCTTSVLISHLRK
jgi:hypothetical protein